jgi:hypothetical protein
MTLIPTSGSSTVRSASTTISLATNGIVASVSIVNQAEIDAYGNDEL